jgi:hypothetical protein
VAPFSVCEMEGLSTVRRLNRGVRLGRPRHTLTKGLDRPRPSGRMVTGGHPRLASGDDVLHGARPEAHEGVLN